MVSNDQIVDKRDNRKFDVDREVMEFYCKHIGGNAYTVYGFLAMYASFMPTVFPSHRLISETTGLSTSTIKRCLKILSAEEGTPLAESPYPPLISIEHRTRENGSKSSNLYVLESVPGRSVLEKLEGAWVKMNHTHRSNLPIQDEGAERGEENGSGFAPSGADRAVDLQVTPETPDVQPIDLVTAWCDVARVDINKIVNRGKQFGAAKKLLMAGVRPIHIPALYRFALSHYRGRNGVDMGVMMGVADEYLAQQNAPTDVYGNPLGRRG